MTIPLSGRLTRLAHRPWLSRRTVRMRLTLLYGGLFLLSGAALLAVTYVLVAHATVRPGYVRTVRGRGVALRVTDGRHGLSTTLRSAAGQAALTSVVRGQRISDLHQLVIWSGIALAGMALASILLGWIIAGRVLRPLRTIAATAEEISAHNLHLRLGLDGPDDELKRLANTIDALLARLEGSFQAQRAFVANASHELRTPLALSRAMLQFTLADPELTFDALRDTCEDVLQAGAEHEQLIEALLTLSRSQQELEHRESVDLAAVVEDVIEAHRQPAASNRLTLGSALDPATVYGDDQLVRRLVNNLVENAIRHNVPGGHLDVAVQKRAQDVTLTISNTGARVPADQIERLLQPFRRLVPDRVANPNGHGLGLSIVAAIAEAHHARLDVEPYPEGGLRVAIAFPRSPSVNPDAAPAVSAPVSDLDASAVPGVAR